MANIPRIKQRYDALQDNKNIFNTVVQDIMTYVLPRKSDVIQVRSPGARRTEKLFDGTAVHANANLAASMHGSLTPSTITWANIVFRDEDLNENRQVKLWSHFVDNLIFLALRLSNFSSEIFEVYLDLGSAATACLFEEEMPGEFAFNGLNFRSVQYEEYVVDEDITGKVDTVLRKFQMTARSVVSCTKCNAADERQEGDQQ